MGQDVEYIEWGRTLDVLSGEDVGCVEWGGR